MNKQPQTLTFSLMQEAISQMQPTSHHAIIERDLAVITLRSPDLSLLNAIGGPFRIDDYRFGLVLRGTMHTIVNLIEHQVVAGTMIVLTPGTIISPQRVSPDFVLIGMAVKAERLRVEMGGQMPAMLQQQMYNVLINDTSAPEQQLVALLFRTIRRFLGCLDHSEGVLWHLVAAQVCQYDHLAQLHNQSDQHEPSVQSHQQQLFNRFIHLVNTHCQREHRLSFYASQLCLTERHLGTVIRQQSGVTAKEWIDRALITHSKVMLKHSDQSVAQIAEALHFPTPSFFSKYFRRLTGLTPLVYREHG